MLVADRAIITPRHIEIMAVVGRAAADFGETDLSLEGGTALAAYHLHHRESEDLDFFGSPELPVAAFIDFLLPRLTAAGLRATWSRAPVPSFAEIHVADAAAAAPGSVKLQVARTSLYRLAPLEPAAEGIRVASYRDLCRGKMEAICGRFELRDYIDLHCIIRRPDAQGPPDADAIRRRIRELIADLMRCDPGMTYPYIGQSLARGRQLPKLAEFPLRLLVPLTDEEVADTIERCVEECASLFREAVGNDLSA